MPWASLLTAKLNNRTRLVGPVITCQDISWPDTIPEAERRRAQPFLPQHMLVADQVLFSHLQRLFTTPSCCSTYSSQIRYFSLISENCYFHICKVCLCLTLRLEQVECTCSRFLLIELNARRRRSFHTDAQVYGRWKNFLRSGDSYSML